MPLKNIAIEAGAGCGKTTRITEDIINGLKNNNFNIDDIVVITFTKKAANELKSRISLKLQEAVGNGDKNLEKQLKNLGNARISTIHSFCEGLLKERPVEAQADPACTVIEEMEQQIFLDQVFDSWLNERLNENPDYYRKLVLDYKIDLKTPDYGFSSLDNSFQGIVKTALGYRELDLFIPKDPGTPDENIKNCLKDLNSLKGQTSAPKLIDFMEDYIARISSNISDTNSYIEGINVKYKPGNLGGKNEKPIKEEWKEACEKHLFNIQYSINFPEVKKLHKETNTEVQSFVEFYREEMRKNGVIDFGEILYKTERLLSTNQTVREYFKNKFSYIFVDEFQDTDPLQAKIFFYLAEKKGNFGQNLADIELEENKIYVVGDPKQSIYKFRRADIEIYNAAMDKISAGKKEYLSTNYRSCVKVIDWVNLFFKNRIKRPLDGNYQADYIPLKHYQKDAGKVIFVEPDVEKEKIEKQIIDDARDMEAKLTASWIKQFIEKGKYTYKDILVIYRGKKNMHRTAQFLEELDIPYELVGAKSYFGRNEVLDMANLLKALSNPIDQVRIVAALKGPFFSLSDKNLFEWKLDKNYFDYRGAYENSEHKVGKALTQLKTWHEESQTSYAGRILKQAISEKGLLASFMGTYRGRQKVLNIIKAIELLDSFGAVPFCMAADEFADRVEENVEMADFNPIAGKPDAVQLMTIHKAKGLENKVVYIADCTTKNSFGNSEFIDNENNRIIFKIKGSSLTPEYLEWQDLDSRREEAESERVRYVAATRAKEVLVINRVEHQRYKGTFSSPLLIEQKNATTETIDIADISVTPGRKPEDIVPEIIEKFSEELNQITNNISQSIEKSSRPVMKIQSPSNAETDTTDVSVKVLYNPDSPGFNIENVPAATIGTLAHKLMELDCNDLKTAAENLIKNEKVNLSPQELVSVVDQLKRNEPTQRIANAKMVLREVPIKYSSGDIYYDGVIDLLFEEEDGWVIVDYKTVKVENENEEQRVKEKYESQMKVYSEGLKQLGIKVSGKIIVTC
jgi:ATP-dependent helicase/nuclease subunit A